MYTMSLFKMFVWNIKEWKNHRIKVMAITFITDNKRNCSESLIFLCFFFVTLAVLSRSGKNIDTVDIINQLFKWNDCEEIKYCQDGKNECDQWSMGLKVTQGYDRYDGGLNDGTHKKNSVLITTITHQNKHLEICCSDLRRSIPIFTHSIASGRCKQNQSKADLLD